MDSEQIKKLVRMPGSTQVELAWEYGCTPSALNQAISGKSRSFRLRTFIARKVGKRVTELFPDERSILA